MSSKNTTAEERLEEFIHGGLEGGGGITKAEQHHLVFIVVVVCSERHLGNIVIGQ